MGSKTDDEEIGKRHRWGRAVSDLLSRGRQWAVIYTERRLDRVHVPHGHAWQREGFADFRRVFVEKAIRK